MSNRIILFFRKRKGLAFFLLLLLVLLLFKGSVYRACVTYEISFPRSDSYKKLSTVPTVAPELVDHIIDSCLELNSRLLSFTTSHCNTEAWSLAKGGKTNCIGYSGLFAVQCNEAFHNYGIGNRCNAEPYVMKLKFLGFDIHQLFRDPFWKDHDAVLITNGSNGDVFIVDPTLYDYTGIGYVTKRK